MKFLISTILKLCLGTILWGSLLFIPAGTIHWPEAWAFLVILFCYAVFLFAFYLKKDTKIAKSRNRIKPIYIQDYLILGVITICFIAFFVVPPLDVFRYHWTDHLVPLLAKYIGISVYTVSLMLYLLVVRENAYLSRVVEIQEEQKLISTGPYSLIRTHVSRECLVFFKPALCIRFVDGFDTCGHNDLLIYAENPVRGKNIDQRPSWLCGL